MNIWILNHYSVPQKYYYLARSYNFAKQLMKRGHKVTVFAASSVHNSDINLIEDNRLFCEIEEDGIPYVLFRARQYQGSGKVFDAKGNLLYDGGLYNGQYDGEGREFYPTGELKYEGTFKLGKYDAGILYSQKGEVISDTTTPPESEKEDESKADDKKDDKAADTKAK